MLPSLSQKFETGSNLKRSLANSDMVCVFLAVSSPSSSIWNPSLFILKQQEAAWAGRKNLQNAVHIYALSSFSGKHLKGNYLLLWNVSCFSASRMSTPEILIREFSGMQSAKKNLNTMRQCIFWCSFYICWCSFALCACFSHDFQIMSPLLYFCIYINT